MPVSHLKIAQSSVLALTTSIIGVVVAFVPQWVPYQQVLIVAVSSGISAVFLIANAVHALASANSKPAPAPVVQVAGQEQAVRDEVARILSGGLTPATVPSAPDV